MNRKLMVIINCSWFSLSGLAQTHVRGCQVAVLILLPWKKKSIAVRNATCVKVPNLERLTPAG